MTSADKTAEFECILNSLDVHSSSSCGEEVDLLFYNRDGTVPMLISYSSRTGIGGLSISHVDPCYHKALSPFSRDTSIKLLSWDQSTVRSELIRSLNDLYKRVLCTSCREITSFMDICADCILKGPINSSHTDDLCGICQESIPLTDSHMNSCCNKRIHESCYRRLYMNHERNKFRFEFDCILEATMGDPPGAIENAHNDPVCAIEKTQDDPHGDTKIDLVEKLPEDLRSLEGYNSSSYEGMQSLEDDYQVSSTGSDEIMFVCPLCRGDMSEED